MGAQKSIQAGKAKIDVNVDFSHQLCGTLFPAYLNALRHSDSPLSQIIGSLCIKHPNLFGRSEKLDVLLDKGLYESNIFVAYRRPSSHWLAQQTFVVQHSVAPEVAVHGVPVDNFSRSGSGGVNLCRFSAGLNLNEPASSAWSSTTSIRYEHVRLLNDDGRCISRDMSGLPVTCRYHSFDESIQPRRAAFAKTQAVSSILSFDRKLGGLHDNMVVVKTESQYGTAKDDSFSQLNFQIEQGLPIFPKWLAFNRFKFLARRGTKVGPVFLLMSLTGGSIVGDMAPCQAFSIGGIGSVRGYGEGAVGSGRQCLIVNNEVSVPLGILPLGMGSQGQGLDMDVACGSVHRWGKSRLIMLSMVFNRRVSTLE
ncbi:outer envelope protein 39, chloroplastic isoform X2 [Nymphaea colorata]|uniref:outer envelope protein 39, chloroplastic isoform X2 n=1 Tax=Nymphaea colorata TaxID=210225 RepID=UPI00129E24DE|nr:outer envelope protein 39, chloroplastic isoform X2 [Nymphaea colorata]